MALATMGGTGASHLYLRSLYVKIAPARVVRLPKIISGRAQPVKILDSRHPMKSPGMAAGVK